MEITKHPLGEKQELRIKGRLDAYWSDHLSTAISESMHEGFHRLELNLAQVDYISSAGIRVMLTFYKQLRNISGSLEVIDASDGARRILESAGLTALFSITTGQTEFRRKVAESRKMETREATVQIYDIAPGATLQCRLTGEPRKLEGGGFAAADCQRMAFPGDSFAVGLGAFGTNFEECRARFGEFLAAGGAAAYLPTDGTGLPDYVVTEGSLVPEMNVLYALGGHGAFAQLVRFEAKAEAQGKVSLAAVVEAALESSCANTIGVVMVAESAGLVGAALTKSPARLNANETPLAFPTVRDWLSFTAERAFDRTLCVIVGVASRKPSAALAPFLRSVGTGTNALGHFHAAVFPYKPLQRGELKLQETVNGLFAFESIQGLLHLLADDRTFEGVGQSEFLRGACWVGVIAEKEGGRE